MVARGYRGNPVKHRVYFLTKLSIKPRDWAAIVGLLMLVAFSTYTEIMLPP
jgi:energy-coupling factor transporter transmembrane protein EcfT